MGANAALFSSRPRLARRAKYELVATARVSTAGSDAAYNSIRWVVGGGFRMGAFALGGFATYQSTGRAGSGVDLPFFNQNAITASYGPDDDGRNGVYLAKGAVAGESDWLDWSFSGPDWC
jgi:hypothetical protein